ncbi:serine/threonine-protein kinase [Chondromyces crocatus]|uniref:Protein kinase n=1 Tax=Chondromyces crocatus TaxID=52 RepID=A0A0K1ERP5_CHOCO|nr:serine/threonine-protein kinase [Chondromyces crocatus]AKT43516.1 protein kinase [Chondromyces crocatus]
MQPGQHITTTLRLVQPLGKGGMGSVWIADHLGLGIQVAVKFIAQQLLTDESMVLRFRREAMAAAQIRSPHVAQVFDHGVTSEGLPFIVMELLEGELLGDRVKRLGALPPRDTALIVTQVAKALTRAHEAGIVHRDIKPDNLFLTEVDGELLVKVIDFGVAKQGSHQDAGMTTTGSMVGTPLYMSPEQLFSAKHTDHRADLWSLAVVAYHAMTGRPPFTGDTLGALSVAVYTGVHPLPSAVQPGLPLAIDAWFHRALQREPQHRFQSARELSETLEQAVMGASWTAWSGTALPAPVLGAEGALQPPEGLDRTKTSLSLNEPAPVLPFSALPGGAAPLDRSGPSSVAQGNLAVSAVPRTGPSTRPLVTLLLVACLAAIGGAVGAVLLLRGGEVPAGAAGTSTLTSATMLGSTAEVDTRPVSSTVATVLVAAPPEAEPTASPAASETTRERPAAAPQSVQTSPSKATGAATPSRPAGRTGPVSGSTPKGTPRPTATRDTIGF